MKCSFEIPTAHIKELKEHQEYDFVLAHMWLEDAQYRASYNSGMVMDNGAYELGEPLEVKTLHRVVRAARPTVMIAPDWLDDKDRTLNAWKECSLMFECEVAGVVVGKTLDEMIDCYKQYTMYGTEIICLPFRLNRVELLTQLEELKIIQRERWHHFLGLKHMEELQQLKSFKLPLQSVDTSKPLKAAIFGKTIYDNLQGLGKIDLGVEYEQEVVERMRFQMDRFREEAQRA